MAIPKLLWPQFWKKFQYHIPLTITCSDLALKNTNGGIPERSLQQNNFS